MPTRTIHGTSGVLGRRLTLELDGSALRVKGRFRRRELTLSGARVGLGVWVLPGVWTAIGAFLCVDSREGRLRVGAHGRAVPIDDRTMSPETTVDVMVDDADFDALRSALLPERRLAEPPRGRPRAFEVVRNTVSGLGALMRMKPWFLTIFFLCVLGPAGGLMIGDSPAGTALLTVVVVAVIAVGLRATYRASTRPPSPHRLEVGPESIALRDPEGAILVDVARASVTMRRGIHRVSSRSGSFSVPTLELRDPARTLLRLGVWDSRFARDAIAERHPAPRYLVGATDWEALLDALGREASS